MKQVPDTEAAIKAGADQKSIAEAGIKFIINPFDEFALEEALRIKEALGAGKIKAIAMGPERAKEALRGAAALGVDEVLLLKTDTPSLDGLAVAQVLAETVAKESFDLILMGKEAIDDGNMQVGPMLAELLNIPCLNVATKVVISGQQITVEREGDNGVEVLETTAPAIVTCQKGLNEPRYPSIRGKMAAMKMVIAEQAVALNQDRVSITGMQTPPSRSGGKIVGEGAAAVPELINLLRSEAKVL
jgi:electron transfer flavoprotein beta subunit